MKKEVCLKKAPVVLLFSARGDEKMSHLPYTLLPAIGSSHNNHRGETP